MITEIKSYLMLAVHPCSSCNSQLATVSRLIQVVNHSTTRIPPTTKKKKKNKELHQHIKSEKKIV